MGNHDLNEHQNATIRLHTLIVVVFGVLALFCIIGGIIGIFWNVQSPTEFVLFGAHFTTGHISVAFVAIGLLIAFFTVRSVLKNQRELAVLSLRYANQEKIIEPVSQPQEIQRNKISEPSVKNKCERFDPRKITTTQILDAIDNVPPMQQDDVVKCYVGLQVEWDVALFHAEKANQSMARVTFSLHSDCHHGGIIETEVPLSRYPELSVIKRDTIIRVLGKIEKIDPPCFWLSDVELKY